MIVVVTGGRAFKSRRMVESALSELSPVLVLSGGCRGADRLAMEWCAQNGVPGRMVFADWNRYGRSAGPKRNRVMVRLARRLAAERGCEAVCVAFSGGLGTASCVREAFQAGLRVLEGRGVA